MGKLRDKYTDSIQARTNIDGMNLERLTELYHVEEIITEDPNCNNIIMHWNYT